MPRTRSCSAPSAAALFFRKGSASSRRTMKPDTPSLPCGRAPGVTASLPEEDRHSYPKDYLLGRLVMLFGGRAAEELVFGPEKITTGAGNDIERATDMARRMGTQFGMSDLSGPMAAGDA